LCRRFLAPSSQYASIPIVSDASFSSGPLLKSIAKSPVYFYRYAISPLLGPRCRHMPTCSQYALDAIELNGAWVGGLLAASRVARCHPWGTSGYDPAPDLSATNIPFWAPWRYLEAERHLRRQALR
jgi:putative membrane protein insertion efficiency factor